MLVLTREINESIIVNDNIKITLIDIRGGKARIGIEAPKEIPVHREEVHLAIQRESPNGQVTSGGRHNSFNKVNVKGTNKVNVKGTNEVI